MRKILITGGSEGIGQAAARALAAEGGVVTLVARNPEKLQAALRSLPGSGHSSLAADLSTPEGVALVAKHIDENRYNVFFNNAGSGLYGRFTELPLDKQLILMHLNMDAVTVLAHHYLALARPGDALVNTGSALAFVSLPGSAVYAASRAYVANLSESLWWEFKGKGIYVLGFNPGVVNSGFHNASGGTDENRAAGQAPEAVAQELLRALRQRRHPRVVSGVANRLTQLLMRVLPRKTIVNMMGRFGPLKPA